MSVSSKIPSNEAYDNVALSINNIRSIINIILTTHPCSFHFSFFSFSSVNGPNDPSCFSTNSSVSSADLSSIIKDGPTVLWSSVLMGSIAFSVLTRSALISSCAMAVFRRARNKMRTRSKNPGELEDGCTGGKTFLARELISHRYGILAHFPYVWFAHFATFASNRPTDCQKEY